jgi:MoaA/NifB/PqqE/SkfB family radical SAM enzyme
LEKISLSKKSEWLRYINYARYLFFKKNAQPFYLVHFLTNNCNANCAHCLRYGLKASPDRELSLLEIERLTRNLGDSIYSVTLTGGEALLRNDFEGIAKAYLENSNIRTLQILSNGSLVNRITSVAGYLASSFPNKMISFELSLDGKGAQHDELRRFPGLFEKTLQSYFRLTELQKRYQNLKVGFNMTLTSANQNRIMDLYHYLVRELKTELLKVTLIRGEIKQKGLKNLNLTHYKKLCCEMEHNIGRRKLLSISPGNWISTLVQAQDVKARQRVFDTAIGLRYTAPCYAGMLSGVIFANGDVGPCELLPQRFGNLRNHGFHIPVIWKTAQAAKIRHMIHESKCFCTYECAMLCNILFNPSYWPSLIKETASLWLARKDS